MAFSWEERSVKLEEIPEEARRMSWSQGELVLLVALSGGGLNCTPPPPFTPGRGRSSETVTIGMIGERPGGARHSP